jgi:hypothetical protein
VTKCTIELPEPLFEDLREFSKTEGVELKTLAYHVLRAYLDQYCDDEPEIDGDAESGIEDET